MSPETDKKLINKAAMSGKRVTKRGVRIKEEDEEARQNKTKHIQQQHYKTEATE